MTERELTNRLALGTVQFGLPYGINNVAGKPSLAQVSHILDTAANTGINVLDTAASYGDSETRMGALLSKRSRGLFGVITKISPTSGLSASNAISASLTRLRHDTVEGILLHSFQQATDLRNWEALYNAQSSGKTKKIGVSIYHPSEALWLLRHRREAPCNIVQLPFNIFDQRMVSVIPDLAYSGIEVHVRSVFLQGLLLRPADKLPNFFASVTPKLACLQELANVCEVTLPALLLLFALQTPGVSRVIIGVDSVKDLHEVISSYKYYDTIAGLRSALAEFSESNPKIILPYLWPSPSTLI